MKRVLIITAVIVLTLGFLSCSNSEDEAYQRGYEDGYAEGRTIGKSEGQKIAETATNAAKAAINKARQSGYEDGYQAGKQTGELTGYQTGYQEGFDESTRLLGPKDELVKVLSYKLTRDRFDYVEVAGELQNMSNKRLRVTANCALLNSSGEIVATNLITYRETLEPQQKAFFTFGSFYEQPQAVDARITVAWDEK